MQCVLFLVLAGNFTLLDFYAVTCSYSSRPFLCALVMPCVIRTHCSVSISTLQLHLGIIFYVDDIHSVIWWWGAGEGGGDEMHCTLLEKAIL